MENKIKNRDIKLDATQKKRMKLVREPNFYGIKHFTNDLSAFEKRKTNILMDKPIYFGFTILELSKVALIYEFWYEYLKPKYGKNRILPYGYRFVVHIKAEDFYEDSSNDVEKFFDTTNCEHDIPLPMGLNTKVIGMMKEELEGGGRVWNN